MPLNQSVHLTIKEPPNPNPVRTLGIFELPIEPSIINAFLSGVGGLPKDAEFIDNVKDEVLKVLSQGTVQSVARSDNLFHIIIALPK
jgi:hypothetical protein